ncbi:MAG: bifunctional folylpolyglutamate synthase/dihydrofolate synthase [Hymenobacter sp.]|nr:MAG: bifunctional folylpolyglutamate synthase/dihydrofolate synthase [Hymenobacter sp.]
MTYAETLAWLYAQLPMYQRVGAAGFKKGLGNTEALAAALGHPETQFRSVHVAGTNGKGSSAHLLAAVLQSAGYKVGLYTSPHLREFTERIRVNGQEIAPDYLVRWVAEHRKLFAEIEPSFFEMCVALAFDYFAAERVDVAVVEVGLGGRLDSTNIIPAPLVSLITNISYDHQAMLGNTLPEIAAEKAGIIKPGRPVVVSQSQPEVAAVFIEKARQQGSSLVFADLGYAAKPAAGVPEAALTGAARQLVDITRAFQPWLQQVEVGLPGDYQRLNLPGVLAVVEALQAQGFAIPEAALRQGLREVTDLTGLRGRWSILGQKPLVVADTAHNEAGLQLVLAQLARVPHRHLHLVIGTVNDKDVAKVLALLPREATYYFCQADIPRALPADELAALATAQGLRGRAYGPVPVAVAAARAAAAPDDVVFIGGSTFVVAEII